MALELSALLPDCHIPYHHVKAYSLVMKVLSDLPLSEICLYGDYADFYSVSQYGKHPSILNHLQYEVDAVNKCLDELDQLFPRVKKVFIEGNHEYRLERYLVDKCPALFGITEAKFLFKIPQRYNWYYHKYQPNQMYHVGGSDLIIRHEPLGSTAKNSAKGSLCSTTYGHIHRIEEAWVVSLEGKQIVNFSPGWLGDKRNDLIFNYIKGHHQWQLGFSLVYTNKETKQFYHQIVPIIENGNKVSCVVKGKYYEA